MKNLFIFLIILIFSQNASLSQSCLPEGITFINQSQIDNFQANYPGCSVIEGDVFIGEIGPSSNINNLAGLSSITRINGYLNIHYLDNLINMDGLENLTYIGGDLRFIWNNHLTNIDALANLDTIGGQLNVKYSFFDDLTGFASLKYIGGNVEIFENFSIKSLNGLSQLKVIGGELNLNNDDPYLAIIEDFNSLDTIYGNLQFYENSYLTDITGFNHLKYIGGSLIITENEDLTSVQGFSELNHINNSVSILNNFILSDVSGLASLESVGGSLVFYQAPLLPNSFSFINLVEIGGKFELSYCNSFSELSDFQNLQSVGGGMRIYNNDKLLSLTSLGNLTSVGGDMVIYYNDTLSSLAGLGNIDPNSIQDMEIIYNPILSECDIQSVCNYLLAPTGSVIIYHNAAGCNSPPEIAGSCGNTIACLPYGNYYFFSQHDIDNFQTDYPGCTQPNGLFEIKGSNIYNLEPLSVISSINGTLHICSNDILFVLFGLNNLTTISQNLLLEYNSSLTDLSGLAMLSSIGGSLTLNVNSSLQNLDGFNNLETIGGSLTISVDEMLNDLTGLSKVDTLGGSLIIGNNASMLDLEGLSSLTSIRGEIKISYNDNLNSLHGLENINFDSISNMQIRENPKLSECAIESVCEYIANPGGTIDISYNATGCSSVAEVDSICFPVSINELKEKSYLTIYPNPAKNWLNIESEEELRCIRIYNLLGEEVLKLEIGYLEKQVDVSRLQSGIYYVNVTTVSKEYKEKIVILR